MPATLTAPTALRRCRGLARSAGAEVKISDWVGAGTCWAVVMKKHDFYRETVYRLICLFVGPCLPLAEQTSGLGGRIEGGMLPYWMEARFRIRIVAADQSKEANLGGAIT